MTVFNIKSKIALFLFVGIVASACTEKIELDLPDSDETFLVVEGWVNNLDALQTVKLSYTSPYFETDPQPIASGANVVIRDDQGPDIVLAETSPGVYSFNGPGEIGHAYQLYIELEDGEVYESNYETLYEVVPIDSIYWQLSDREPNDFFDEDPDDIYEVLINTVEPATLGNYYRWRSFLNGVEDQDPDDIFTIGDDFVNGNPIPNFNVTDELYSQWDTVTLIQEQISKEASAFLTLLQSQTAFVGSPFDSPPSPIVGNIVNLTDSEKIALGYFGTAAQSKATIVVGIE